MLALFAIVNAVVSPPKSRHEDREYALVKHLDPAFIIARQRKDGYHLLGPQEASMVGIYVATIDVGVGFGLYLVASNSGAVGWMVGKRWVFNVQCDTPLHNLVRSQQFLFDMSFFSRFYSCTLYGFVCLRVLVLI